MDLKKTLNGMIKVYFKVPNVRNMNIKDAKKKLSNFTIEYSGTGTVIADQSREPGEKITENSTVKLLLK